MREKMVPILRGCVAWKASFEHAVIGGFPVFELSDALPLHLLGVAEVSRNDMVAEGYGDYVDRVEDSRWSSRAQDIADAHPAREHTETLRSNRNAIGGKRATISPRTNRRGL